MTRRSAFVVILALLLGCAPELKGPGPFNSGLDASSPVFAGYNVHWLTKPDRVREDLARLSFVSAWAFQEVSSTRQDENRGSPSRLIDILPPGGWHVAWVPVNPVDALFRGHEREGQAIASRHPIRAAEVWELKTSGGKRRVALVAVLDINGRLVRFVNTDHEPAVMSFVRGNVRQAKRLLAHLARRDDLPTVVAGDFNTTGCVPHLVSAGRDRAELLKLMNGAGFCPADRRHIDEPTFRWGLFSATLDHIFVHGAMPGASGVDGRATGSDHLPVWCEVILHGSNVAGATSAPSGTLNPTR